MKISGLVREVLHVGFLLGGFLLFGGVVEAADHPAFQPVKELFAAMSKHDGKAMQETATEDFQLLEHGEDWTMQQLVEALMPFAWSVDRGELIPAVRDPVNVRIITEVGTDRAKDRCCSLCGRAGKIHVGVLGWVL